MILIKIVTANREMRNLLLQKAHMEKATQYKRCLSDEEKDKVEDELDEKANNKIAEMVSQTLESKLSEAEEKELKEHFDILRNAYRNFCRAIHPDLNKTISLEEIKNKMNEAGLFNDLLNTLNLTKDLVEMRKLHDFYFKTRDIIEAYRLFSGNLNQAVVENLSSQLKSLTLDTVEMRLFLLNIKLLLPIDKSLRFEVYYNLLLEAIQKQKDELVQQNKEFDLALKTAIVALEQSFISTDLVNIEKSSIKFIPAKNFSEAKARPKAFIKDVEFSNSNPNEVLVFENKDIEVKALKPYFNFKTYLPDISISYKNTSNPEKLYYFTFKPKVKSFNQQEYVCGSSISNKIENLISDLQNDCDLEPQGLMPIERESEMPIDYTLNTKTELLDILKKIEPNKLQFDRKPSQYINKRSPLIVTPKSFEPKTELDFEAIFERFNQPYLIAFNELGQELASYGVSI